MQETVIQELNKQLLDLEEEAKEINKKIASVRHKISAEKQKEYDKIQEALFNEPR